MVNVRTVHGSRYMLIRSKDWLEVFFKASVLFLCLEKTHNESINYICTYCSKDNTTVCEMQVLCLMLHRQSRVIPVFLVAGFLSI